MFERGLFSIFAGRVLAASFLAAGFAFLGANAAQAADPSFVGVLAYATDDAGARQLGLSDETRRALMELIEKREAEALELVLEIQSLPTDQQQARLKPFREESERMGMALLSEAQRGLLKQMRLERVGLVALGEPEIAAKLQLTDEQRTAVTELLREREESMARATEQQRPKQVLYYERKLAEVITPEQLQAWEALARSAGDETPPTDQASPSPDAIAAQPPAATAPAATAPEPTTPAPSTDASPEPTKSAAVPSTRPTARVLPPRSTQPSPDGKVSFDFTFQPWKDVLNWIAQQADLSLVMDDTPPGTFNYRDDRRHTPDEAIDIVNTALLRKGYTLIRSGRMLMLVNIQNGIPSNLLPTVAPSELEERGKHELVSTVFAVNKLTPDEAEQVIRKLLGPQGEVVPLTQAKQLLVTETASRLITIRQVLDKAENPSGGSEGLRTFVLEHARPADVLATAKQLLDIPADRISNADSSLHITTDPAGRLVAGGKPEMVARLADMIKMLDVPGRAGSLADEQPQLEVYPISSADPTSALQIMQTLLAGMPDVRLTVDPKTGHLVALARPSQHATIRATLDQLQRDGRRLEVIPLRNADPQTAVLAINKLFGADGDNPSATAPRVEAEPTLRQLLVRGTASQVEQIKAMVQQMEGRDSSLASGQGSRGNLRLIPLSGRQTRSALEQIQAVWSATHTNPIRVVTPSNAIPEIRPNASDDSPESNPVLPPQTFPSQSSKQRAPQTPAPSPAPPASKSAEQKFRGFRVQFASQATEHGETAQQPDVQRQAIQLPGIQQNSIQQPAEVTPDANDETDDEIVDIPGAPIVVIPGPNGILIASDDRKALDAFEALLTTLTSQQFRGGREYTIFYLKYAKAVKVAELLDQIFGGGGGSSGGGGNLIGDLAGAALGGFGGGLMGDLLGGGGDDSGPAPVRGNSGPLYIVPDARLNALVVQGSPTDLDTIEHLLKVLDQANSPEEVTLVARPRLIPVVNTSAESIAEVVKQVYQDRMTSGQQRQPSPQEFFAALRGGRGGRNDQRRQDDAELQRLTIGVDTRNNSLVVSAADPLFNEVKALVEQLDQPSDESRETTRVVTLTNTNPDAVKSALVSVLGDQAITSTAANNNQRSRTSSQSSSSGQQTGGGDLGRQMQMFNALQGGGFGGGGWGRGGFGGGGGGWGRGGGGGRGGFGGGGRGGFGGGGGQGGGGGRGRN